jgi:hypothetical protein
MNNDIEASARARRKYVATHAFLNHIAIVARISRSDFPVAESKPGVSTSTKQIPSVNSTRTALTSLVWD